MYVWIGGNVVLPDTDIVGIFDLDNVSRGKDTRRLLSSHESAGRVHGKEGELPRTLIVTDEELYVSAVLGRTLAKRAADSQRGLE